MPPAEHPSWEELLLWHSGELPREQSASVQSHLNVCKNCASQAASLTNIYEDVNWVSAEAAQRGLRSTISARKRSRFFTSRTVTAGIAAALIVALIGYTFSDFTPEARADSLLSKAIGEQAAVPHRSRLVHFTSGREQCQFALGPDGSQSGLASLASSPLCSLVTVNLRAVAWSDPLSASNFEHWRRSIKKKTDTVTKLPSATEVTTATKEGPLRSATLRMRISDDLPVAARFEFVDSAGALEPPIDVTEQDEDAPQQAALLAAARELVAPHASGVPRAPVVADPMDDAEARVRLALHRLGLDGSVLLAIDRTGSCTGANTETSSRFRTINSACIKLWGVVPTEEAKKDIYAEFESSPEIQMRVLSESEEAQQQAPLPWTAAHGDSRPLAFDQVKALFADNPDERQDFLNSIDAVTRRLAGEAKTRDALLPLAGRLRSSPQEQPLREAIADLDSRMFSDAEALATQLKPLTGSAHARAARLSYPQAMELYTLVHEVVFQSSSDQPLALDAALARIRALLAPARD